jgi:hypothetical protein
MLLRRESVRGGNSTLTFRADADIPPSTQRGRSDCNNSVSEADVEMGTPPMW